MDSTTPRPQHVVDLRPAFDTLASLDLWGTITEDHGDLVIRIPAAANILNRVYGTTFPQENE